MSETENITPQLEVKSGAGKSGDLLARTHQLLLPMAFPSGLIRHAYVLEPYGAGQVSRRQGFGKTNLSLVKPTIAVLTC